MSSAGAIKGKRAQGLGGLLVLLGFVACRVAGETGVTTQAGSVAAATPELAAVQPSATDLAVAVRFEQLAGELRGPRTREIMNLLRGESPDVVTWLTLSEDNPPARALARLAGREQTTAAQLKKARGVYELMVAKLEQTQKLPAAFPRVAVKRPRRSRRRRRPTPGACSAG